MTARHPRLQQASWWLLVAGITSFVVLSAQTLAWLGVPYDLPVGGKWAKLHLGSWLVLLSLICALWADGQPLAEAWRRVQAMRLVALALACMVTVAAWSVARSGTSGAAFIIDALWVPCLVLLAMQGATVAQRRALLCWLMALLVLNALLALGEFVVGRTVVPRYALEPDLVADEGFFRATALMGHPLANALQTLTLMPAALLLPARWRWPVAGLLLIALLPFGSRSALAAALLVYGGALVASVLWRALHGRYSYLQLTGGLFLCLVLFTAGGIAAWASGLGERIFANLTWDQSANARLVAWDALSWLDDEAWFAGVSPAQISDIALRIGLDPRFEAIENFWVVLLMQFGLVGFLPFLLGLGALLLHLWRQAVPAMRLAMLVYLVVASGANTLASKTASLTLLAVGMACSSAWRSSADVHRAPRAAQGTTA